ncbi:hypothetical protein [Actinoplanes sp. CA-252034]|uniref:hypothetical protein n=1 Tax=Actinoplanes sp. CA-252034 TaxID=3239906 RepID=UPI003D97CC19
MKKNQRLLKRPEALWAAMLVAFGRLGPALCPPAWFASLLGEPPPRGERPGREP